MSGCPNESEFGKHQQMIRNTPGDLGTSSLIDAGITVCLQMSQTIAVLS